MRTLARNADLDSEVGTLNELPKAGSTLEIPYVYDATARELKEMAQQGLVKIVDEHRRDGDRRGPISKLTFKRLR